MEKETYVMMVTKIPDGKGDFYKKIPVCVAMPRQNILEAMAEKGYIPFTAYKQLLAQGKNRCDILSYVDTFKDIANEALGNCISVHIDRTTPFEIYNLLLLDMGCTPISKKIFNHIIEKEEFCNKVLEDLVAA